jgi:hypothetical protein
VSKKPKPPLESKAELTKEILRLVEAQFICASESAEYLLQYFSTFDLLLIRRELKEHENEK